MRLEEQIRIDCPPDAVWPHVCAPERIGRLMDGRLTVVPEHDGQDAEVRARYRVLLQVGSVPVGGEIELTDHVSERELAWTSVTGVEQRFRLRLRPASGGGTQVVMRMAYGSPGTLLGTVADVVAMPQVRSLLRAALATLKAQTEESTVPDPRAGTLAGTVRGVLGAAADQVAGLRVLTEAGVVRPLRPDKLPRLGLAYLTRGASIGTGVVVNAIRHGDATMLHDERGALSFRELDERTDAIAGGLAQLGVEEGDGVAVMARNHRGFVEAVGAVSKLGADALFLNTSFSAPQLEAVLEREQPAAVIFDAEFADLLKGAARGPQRILSWTDADDGGDADLPTLDTLAEQAAPAPPAPRRPGRLTILTSGTTGTPKGARRDKVGADLATALLSRIPLREGMTTVLPAPLFHAWGLAGFGLSSMLLGGPLVLRRKFDPETVLQDIETHRAEAMFVVPVMLARILELPEDVRAQYDLSSLRVVAASGSALPGDLASRWMDFAGDTLYNMYGSTEVTFATIARPEDMRAAPGTAGKPPRGVIVRLYDEQGGEVPQGESGRIFVGNGSLFEGYTGGGSKDRVGGLMATGDLGRFDEAGRLFVVGRDDEMIVSGGENVFPKEVEDCLLGHAAVADAAAVGVEDEKFGQRLKAYLVKAEGAGDPPADDELKQLVKDNLAGYKVPREFVWLDELPRNATGKVVKRELAES